MTAFLERLSKNRGWTLAVSLALVTVISVVAVRMARTAPPQPTAEAARGEFVDRIELRGEIRAMSSRTLNAPAGAGDIQILSLVKTGTPVKKGDPVIVFDSTNMQRELEQRQTELKQAEAEIDRTRAQWHITEEQNQTTLMQAQYDVERAKLEVTKAEILSAIEGEKNRLLLSNAEKRLAEVVQKIASDKIAAEADTASRIQRREKARYEVNRAQGNIDRLTIAAPVDGLFNLLPNFRTRGPFGGTPPDFRPGDRAWSGAAIAELPNLSTLRVTARVEEADRGRLKPGQDVTIRVDALPDKEFTGRVEEIGVMAKLDFSTWPPPKNFDLVVALDQTDPRLRPGMTATPRIAVERIKDAILIPAEAVFQKAGRAVVYVLKGSKFEERVIEVARRGNGQVAVASGLAAGDRVALTDPTLEESAKQGTEQEP